MKLWALKEEGVIDNYEELMNNSCLNSSMMNSSNTVSYTHLDVYKRQHLLLHNIIEFPKSAFPNASKS